MRSLADDLLDTYYSIVHIRLPILDPDEFRSRFGDPDAHPDGPLCSPLVAVALAWGARFSDHPLISADREEMSRRSDGDGQDGPGRSRIVQLMIIRAREVAEVHKAWRLASLDNVRLAVLMESLLARKSPSRPIVREKQDHIQRVRLLISLEAPFLKERMATSRDCFKCT